MNDEGMTLQEWRAYALSRVDKQRAAAVLDGIDAIDWMQLKHAHGRADDVPEMLYALFTEDEIAIEAVWQELCETIWHQGTVYSATIAAVPFFQRMLVHGELPRRYDILMFLQMVARSSLPDEALPEAYYEKQRQIWSRQGRDFDAARQRLQEVQRSLYSVVSQGMALYRQFLDDSDPQVREAVHELIAIIVNEDSA